MEYVNIQKVSGKRPNALGSKELTGQAKKDLENWLQFKQVSFDWYPISISNQNCVHNKVY